jgi:ATP-binding cassette subfamily B protein
MPERKCEAEKVNFNEGIEVINASFRYPGNEKLVVKNINLKLNIGETLAIVGENGAGKSTLVRLITGIYLPVEGTVKVGGADMKEISASAVYNGISAVFQKFQRYKMTLHDNVAISDSMNKSKIEDAILKAGLDPEKINLPEGTETMLAREFNGVDLSGGQWQRVAIARGLYRVHDMIILDEPTAAIDPIEETRIYKKFAEISRGKISVIVTHRLGSAKIADRIIVMDEGRIVEAGTHDELLKAGGKYSYMFAEQARWYRR